MANIYTYHNVDFQKALDLIQKAASLIKTIQETSSVESLPNGSFFPLHRLSYSLRYESSGNALFPQEFQAWVNKENLHRLAMRISRRGELLNTLLGEIPGQDTSDSFHAEPMTIEPGETQIWKTVLKEAGTSGEYAHSLWLLDLLWRQRAGTNIYWESLRQTAKDVLDSEQRESQVSSDTAIRVRYMAGLANIETGHFSDGVGNLTEMTKLYQHYEKALRDSIVTFQQRADAQASEQRMTSLTSTIIGVLAAGMGGNAGLQGTFIGQGIAQDILIQANQAAIDRLGRLKVRGLNAFLSEHEQINLHYYLGFGLESMGTPQEAVAEYKLAVDMIEQQRATIGAEGQRIIFLQEKERVYERLIPLLIQQGASEDAFSYMERGRSRAFVDLLASTRPQFATLKESEAYRTEAQMRVELDMLAEANGIPRQEAQKIHDSLRGVSVVAGVEQERQSQRSAEFQSLIAVQTAPLSEIAQIVGKESALVAFYVTKDSTVVVLLQDGHLSGWLIPIGRDVLTRRVAEIRTRLTPDQPITNIQRVTKQFYKDIVEGAFRAIKKPTVYVVPHGPLHYLPFGALYDGNQYLLDRYTLLTVPSGTVLTYLQRKQSQSPGTTIVFANPDLGAPELILPYAEKEATIIKAHRSDALLNLGKAATKRRAREQAPQAGVLHFATHATFDAARPLNSAILLSRDESSDGRLTAGEIFGLHLPGSLVVLSGCETGMEAVTSGDEIIGFTRAFMYAGAPHLIATLWPIADEATSVLMDKFYAQLSVLPPADSLRRAQMAIRKQYAHPFYWAPFIAYGLHREQTKER